MDRIDRSRIASYDIEGIVGSGGMGTVYRARHRRLGVVRALKVLPSHLASDPDFRERFRREAAIAAELRHPNIVQIYDFDEDAGTFFYVMELIPGRSLQRLVLDEGALDEPRALQMLAQVGGALDYLHSLGIIHRDLKSANLIVSNNDHITLVDFGIARALQAAQITATGALMGTPEYVAPEALAGQPTDPGMDRYALGVLAYELLVGHLPFRGADMSRLLYLQAHEPPPLPTAENPAFPPPLEPVLLKQLLKDPRD